MLGFLAYVPDISTLGLCKYWILSIVSQTLHIIEELSEI